MRKTLMAIFLILLLTAGAVAAKRSFTIEDLYRLKSIGDPQISPDGSKIAFVVTSYNLHEGKSNSDIYMINSNGSGLRQLTTCEKGDFHPRWSPDGKTLMFVSTRKEGPQVWLLPVDGGEAKQLTHFYTGVTDPEWSPNGKNIVFSSDVLPEFGACNKCNKKILTTMEDGPVQAHMADQLLYRHWTFYRDGKRTHIFIVNVKNGGIKDLTPGNFDCPPFALGGARGYVYSPGGNEICYVSNHDKDQASSTNKDLWIVRASGGKAKNITSDNHAYDGDPLYSPDGRYIAYRLQKIPGYESDRFRLAIYDRKTYTKKVLTESFDNWIDEFKWSPDSKWIYFTGEVQGHYPLYRVEVKSGKIEKVLDAKTIRSFRISPCGKWITFTRSSVGEPYELYRASIDGRNLKRLTFFNKKIEDEVDIRPAETVWVHGADGAKIEVFIVKPHNFDPTKKYPLILNVHGGPQMMWADSFRGDWQVYPGAGYVVAFPNPHGSTGYGQNFTAAISRDWGGKVIEDVMKVTDYLANLPYVDNNRMGAMGWSWGGYAMMWLEGHTDRFKAIVSMMGVYDLRAMYGATEELWFPEWDLGGHPWDSSLYKKFSPSNYVKNFKTPCLVITGEKDYRVPYTQSLEFFTDLQKMNVPSRLIVFKNDGHWPNYVKSMPLYYNAHLDWFHKYLGGDAAPWNMLKLVRNRAFETKEKKRDKEK